MMRTQEQQRARRAELYKLSVSLATIAGGAVGMAVFVIILTKGGSLVTALFHAVSISLLLGTLMQLTMLSMSKYFLDPSVRILQRDAFIRWYWGTVSVLLSMYPESFGYGWREEMVYVFELELEDSADSTRAWLVIVACRNLCALIANVVIENIKYLMDPRPPSNPAG